MFDVACTLIDVMAYVQPEQYTFEIGPWEYLKDFTTIMSRVRGGRDRYLPMLLQKANESLPTTMSSLNCPLSSSTPWFVSESIDLDESQTLTSDDSDFIVAPDVVVPKKEMKELVHSQKFSVFTEAVSFNGPMNAASFAPSSNSFLG